MFLIGVMGAHARPQRHEWHVDRPTENDGKIKAALLSTSKPLTGLGFLGAYLSGRVPLQGIFQMISMTFPAQSGCLDMF